MKPTHYPGKLIQLLTSFVILSMVQTIIPESLNAQTRAEINRSYKSHFSYNIPLSHITFPFVGDVQFKDEVENYVFTAMVEPHFFLFTESNTRFAFDIFAGFDVRILKENSLPVRTPSYRPGATLYLQSDFLKDFDDHDYFTVQFMHHSNGQDACPLNGYEYNSDNVCELVPSPVTFEKQFNQYNGSFGTNFLEVGYNISLQRLNSTTRTLPYYLFRRPISQFVGDKYDYFYIGYQYHFIGVEPDLKGRYGLNNLILKYQRITSANWLNSDVERFEADRFLSIIKVNMSNTDKLEGFELINRFNVDLRYYFTWRALSTNSTSVMLMAGYKGQDDYNIYLEDSFPYVGIGLAVGNIIYSIN